MKQIIVSGIQPTGNLHLGNYLGAVKNWVELQNSGKYEIYFFIADLHSLTGKLEAKKLNEQTKILIAELLALGLDPKKITFFRQSEVVGHTELAWVFNCVTQLGELKRMTQFKDKAGIDVNKIANDIEIKENFDLKTQEGRRELAKMVSGIINEDRNRIENKATAGLLTYPILQAADILLYKGNLVPVGEDQVQHVELTRDTARWFNNKYGVEYFPETKALLTKTPRVKSLLAPDKKMSKSLGEGHVLELADEPKVIEAKLKRAVTATEGGGQAPGVENLLLLLKEFAPAKVYKQFEQAEKNKTIRYGDLKQVLAENISKHFTDFRAKRSALLKDEKKLNDIMAEGAARAQEIASKTINEVKGMVGLE